MQLELLNTMMAGIYDVIVSPKMTSKNFKDFCPGSLLEGRAEILKISQTSGKSVCLVIKDRYEILTGIKAGAKSRTNSQIC